MPLVGSCLVVIVFQRIVVGSVAQNFLTRILLVQQGDDLRMPGWSLVMNIVRGGASTGTRIQYNQRRMDDRPAFRRAAERGILHGMNRREKALILSIGLPVLPGRENTCWQMTGPHHNPALLGVDLSRQGTATSLFLDGNLFLATPLSSTCGRSDRSQMSRRKEDH